MDADASDDGIQETLANYSYELRFEDVSAAAQRAAKVRVIDTLGALVGGFFDESSRIARAIAARAPVDSGATIIGTRTKTTPDLAAFVNATTSRCVELNDTYHGPASHGGEFTSAYEQHPVVHRSRVTVTLRNGELHVGEAGADADDLSTPMTDEQVELKFRRLTENVLGARRVGAILDHLWSMEDVSNIGKISEAFTFA